MYSLSHQGKIKQLFKLEMHAKENAYIDAVEEEKNFTNLVQT